MSKKGNIFENLPRSPLPDELFETLLEGGGYKLERIISTGQVTPEDQWDDQEQDEWVVLLKGRAKLLFENNKEVSLSSGDYLFIPAHKRHKVIWTDPEEVCVWLAFYGDFGFMPEH